MTAPAGTVDLSLPDYPTLVARAGVDPRAEAQRVAAADPGTVAGAGAGLGRAGGEMDTAWTQSMGAADTLGAGFTNNGAPVLDRATHIGNLPPEFRDSGTRLAGASRRLSAVAEDLSATMTQTASVVRGMDGELSTMAVNWAQRVAAAGTQDGLIPQEAIPPLLAERDRVAAQMVTRVGDAGRQVTARIRGYEVVINDAVRLLADQGFVPPADLNAAAPPPPTPAYEGGADPAGLGTPLQAGYAADPINTALGNFVEVEVDLACSGLLAGLSIARTYNSRSDLTGPFGARWSSWASATLVERTWTADYEGPDGQRISFPRIDTDFGPAIGVHALVERRIDGLTLAWFDGRRWDFDHAGRLERTWAGPGTAVMFRHDEGGRLLELTHERGRRVMIDWHPQHSRIVTITGSDGRRVDYRYDDTGQLIEAAGPAGARHYGIDPTGRVESVTDADGVVELVNTYDEDGRVLTQRSPFGRTVTFSYQPDGATVVADDSAGPRNTYRHDRAGRLLAATDGHGHTQYKRYDAAGNPIEIVERGGAVTRQEFDHRAHLTRRNLPSGAVYEITWDELDRITSITTTGPTTPPATISYSYTAGERIPSQITDPEGGRTRFAVAGGLVSAVTDPDGVTLRLRHDPDGHLIEARDAAGGVASIERDPAGRPTAVTTPAGRRTELTHDPRGLLIQRRDPTGAVWRHEYSAAGRPTATIDPTGARTETRYGPHGEAAELIDALGAATTHRYDNFGNLTGVTAPDGAKWAYTHDALSRLTAWTDPAGGTWLREHDSEGNITAALDPTGTRTDYTHDESRRLVGVDDGLVVDGYDYDELGRPTQHHRADGRTRRVAHDRCGRRIIITDPAGGSTRHDYTPGGRLSRIVTPAGREQRFAYDSCGRLITRTDGNGRPWQLRYDPDGLLVEKITPTGLVETITRDPAGRITRHRIPGRGTTGYRYDPAGRLTAITDRAGHRQFTHDPTGRVTTATDALGHTTHYTWDDRGNLTAITDPLGGRTERGYDELGRLTSETDPLGRTTAFGYDAAGRLTEQLDPTGARRRWTYDRSGRPAALSAGPDGPTIRIDRDPLGQPIRITETGAATIHLGWDPNGRLAERRTGDRATAWTYDPDGLRTTLTYPDGTHTHYRRDPAGRVTALQHPLLGHITLHRDHDGRLVTMSSAGASSHWSYTDGWLTEHRRSDDERTRTTRLTRDEHGRVLATDTNGRQQLFDYDTAGQLVHSATAGSEQRYTYDAAGRLTSDGQHTYRHDPAGQLRASSGPDGERRFDYDPAGRRTTETGPDRHRGYTWDPLGRLTAIATTTGTGTRTTSLTVDALGELTAVNDTPLTWDTADPNTPLAALDNHPIIGYGHPWATTTGPLHPDWQHTIGDAFDPWGQSDNTPGDELGLGYRGELALDGLLWLRHRAYDPSTRNFLTVDPLAPVPATPYAANPYHYAGNDPVNALDPTGLRPVTDADLAEQRNEDGGGVWGWVKNHASDIGHGALDVIDLVPVVGEAADLVNAGWYALEGDYLNAGLAAAAAIPGLGAAATVAKYGNRSRKALHAAIEAGDIPPAAASEIFYRGMSNAEHAALRQVNELSPRGESFVTQDLSYVQQLAARHPDKYETVVQFDMQPGTRSALIEAGARSPGRLLEDAGLGHLPMISKGQTDVVHVKAEGTSINYGLRPDSAHIFNSRIRGHGPIE